MNLFDDNIIIFILFIGLYYLYFHSQKRVFINEDENIYIEPTPEKEIIYKPQIILKVKYKIMFLKWVKKD